MKILAVSDTVDRLVYSPCIRNMYGDIEVIFGCGDLPYYYLEYIVSALDKPVFYVRGNHTQVVEYGEREPLTHPRGAVNLHRRVLCHNGLLLAGVEGSNRYRNGLYQYTQSEMWQHVFGLIPGFFTNKLKFGRYLDVLVTHAPPWGIHDQTDQPHQGIKAFLWLLRVFKPEYHFHGHIHIYRPDTVIKTWYQDTWVINAFGHKAYNLNLIHYRGNIDGQLQ
jgi:Icc-related predicted phosphoesterase